MNTRIYGLQQDYVKMFKKIMHWDDGDVDPRHYAHGTHPILGNEDDHYLYNAGYALSDGGYYGFSDKIMQKERETYDKIEISYLYLLKSLAEAIGYEYADTDSVWKYGLKDINTDDILKLRKAEEMQ